MCANAIDVIFAVISITMTKKHTHTDGFTSEATPNVFEMNRRQERQTFHGERSYVQPLHSTNAVKITKKVMTRRMKKQHFVTLS